MRRLAYLDGWRGVAILALLAGHFLGGRFFPAGSLGVEIFFVLSGRLMAQILVVERFPLPDFFVRRFSRIYPAMFMLALTLLAFNVAGWAGTTTFADFLAACTFTMNYRVVLFDTYSDLAHLWSVCVEEHCYVLLALICILTRRAWKVTAIVAAVIAALAMANGFRLYVGGAGGVHEIYWRTDVRLASVFASFSLYLLTRGACPWPTLSLVVCTGIGALLFMAEVPLPVRFTVGTLLLAYGVNLLDQVHPWAKGLLSLPMLTRAGIWSYSIYLWQQPFYMAKAEHGAALMLGAAIGISLVSFYFVETPARHWINTKWKSLHRLRHAPFSFRAMFRLAGSPASTWQRPRARAR